jgi:hypothetical protein
MLHISCQTPGGFFQSIHQQIYLGQAWVRRQQSCNRKRDFFKLLELASQPLAIFIELLQRFIAVHKVTIQGFMKLHVLDALMRQLLIFIFKYLSGILLSVNISNAFSWSTRASRSAKAQEHKSDYCKVPSIST